MNEDYYNTDFEKELFNLIKSFCCCGREYCYPEDDYYKTDKIIKLLDYHRQQLIKEIREAVEKQYKQAEYINGKWHPRGEHDLGYNSAVSDILSLEILNTK